MSRGSSVTRMAAGRKHAHILGMSQDAVDAGNTGHLPPAPQGEPDPELCLPVLWPPGSGLPLLSLWPCSNFAAYSQEDVSAREPCPAVTHPDLLGLTGAQP